MAAGKYLHVAVGVIKDKTGNVLISLRHDDAHQGGLWEFPGGKLEISETVEQALKRELKEELDITVQTLTPLIKIKHQYPDLKVLLDVWLVTNFFGEAKGKEGQEIKWVKAKDLNDYNFPAANLPIVTAAKLPNEYAILNADSLDACYRDLEIILTQGVKLIQARIKQLLPVEVALFIRFATPLCQHHNALLLINSAVDNASELSVDGLHLTSTHLMQMTAKPTGYLWVAASCHNLQELMQAESLKLDFVVLAPVLATQTHPDATPLGWGRVAELIEQVNIPVFTLGGMRKKELKMARRVGAQGIAGINCFLKD